MNYEIKINLNNNAFLYIVLIYCRLLFNYTKRVQITKENNIIQYCIIQFIIVLSTYTSKIK